MTDVGGKGYAYHMDFAPVIYGVGKVLNNSQINIAFWNIHRVSQWKVDTSCMKVLRIRHLGKIQDELSLQTYSASKKMCPMDLFNM